MATKRKPPVVALTWAGEELIVVSGRGQDYEYTMLREGKETSRGAAVKGTVRVLALPSGEVMTVSHEGVTRVGRDLVDTGFAVHDVIACHGEVWAGGEGFARYDATARAWVKFELDVTVDEDGAVGFTAGAKGPIVAVNTGMTCQLREFDGRAWRSLGTAPGSLLARAPDGTLYSHHEGLFRRRPKAGAWERVGAQDELMSLAWGPGGLLASTQSVPMRLDEEGTPLALMTRTQVEVATFPLAASGDRFAYACSSNVYVFDAQDACTQWFGPPDEDPAALSAKVASKAFKKLDQKKVRLGGKGLTVFPPALLQATHLEALELEQNSFTSLPDDLGRWTTLRSLNLRMNCLSALPPSFSKLTALEHLDLGMNTCLKTLKVRGARPLREVPPQLRGLTQLKHLVLTMNELSDLPDWLAELPLESLDISSNRFARVPRVVGKLKHLKHLSLGQQPWSSGVTGFPPLFKGDGYRPLDDLHLVCALTGLESLALDRLDLPELPKDLGNLQRLTSLQLGFNERLTTLPDSFYSLQALTSLTAEYAKFTAATLKKLKAKLPSCVVSS